MGFMETLVGAEERVMEMINFLCVVIGGVLMLLALVGIFDFTYRSISFSVLATAFLLFPMAANKVFKKESYVQAPPPIIKKRK